MLVLEQENERESAVLELNSLLSTRMNVTKDDLEFAQTYYMNIINVTSGNLSELELNAAQVKYAHIIKTRNGVPIFDDQDCANLMSENFAIDYDICLAYVKSRNGF